MGFFFFYSVSSKSLALLSCCLMRCVPCFSYVRYPPDSLSHGFHPPSRRGLFSFLLWPFVVLLSFGGGAGLLSRHVKRPQKKEKRKKPLYCVLGAACVTTVATWCQISFFYLTCRILISSNFMVLVMESRIGEKTDEKTVCKPKTKKKSQLLLPFAHLLLPLRLLLKCPRPPGYTRQLPKTASSSAILFSILKSQVSQTSLKK